MHKPPERVLALLPANQASLRLLDAARSLVAWPVAEQIRLCGNWQELVDAARRSDIAVVVFDPHASGNVERVALEQLKKNAPSARLLAYSVSGLLRPREAFALARFGVHELLGPGEDGADLFSQRLLHLLIESCVGQIEQAVGHVFPSHLVPFFRSLMLRAHLPSTPAEVATRLYHSHPNTLRQQLRSARLPPINKLIVWTRLFHAAYHLKGNGCSVDRVVSRLQYPSATALRNQLRRYANLSTTEVRCSLEICPLASEFLRRHQRDWWGLYSDPSPAELTEPGAGE